jgi:XRE family transcriptional regulator, fatty acid utilization regulator
VAIKDRLRDAREKLGITLREASERTGVGSSSLSDFENGKRDPNIKQLQALADVYRKSITFFFSDSPLQSNAILWRQRPESRIALDIEAQFHRLCEQYHNLEQWCEDQVPTALPEWSESPIASKFSDSHVEQLAIHFRRKLGLGERPAKGLLSALEEVCGVKVFHINVDPCGTAASTVNESFGAAILLNANSSRTRRNFDLAHELFHLLTWHVFRTGLATQSAGDNEELLANRFARALLLPNDSVKDAVARVVKDGQLEWCDIFDIARQFDVSFESLLLRMGTIYQFEDDKINSAIEHCKGIAGMFEKQLVDSPRQRPERFCALAIQCLNKGKISAGRFAEYMGITRQEAQSYVAQEVCDDEKIAIPSV